LGFGLIRQGTGLFDPSGRYSYEVAAACSGIRSLIPLIALTWIYGVIAFRTWPRRLLLVAAAVPLTVFCNVLRLGAIVIAGDTFGQDAGHFVHEWFGFVTYGIALVFVYGFERIWPERAPQVINAQEIRR
jgi:exosortase/archaeosortase family protein